MIILCADDYALNDGVCRAIEELADRRRLSATSVLVTSPHWPEGAQRLRARRAYLAIGLHLNLTFGAPLGPMRRLARRGRFPPLRQLILRALLGRIDRQEVAQEIDRQLERFETELGFPPDHVDGHEHVHVLPGVRDALLDALARRYPNGALLIRDPSDRVSAIFKRGVAWPKALLVSVFARGFGDGARQCGFTTNDGFSGFSRFDTTQPYEQEIRRAQMAPGPRHIVMCHPGLANLDSTPDPLSARRQQEYEALARDPALPGRVWRRRPDGSAIDWTAAKT